MAEPTRPPTPAALERALADLGETFPYPPTPDLARAVRLRLAAAPPPRRPRFAWPALFPARRALATAMLVLLALAAVALALLPDLRETVADRLGLRGVRITLLDDDRTPTPPPPPAGADLALGPRTTLADAQAEAPFPLHVPTLAGFDAPDEVYRALGPNRMVSFVYHPTPDLPESAHTGVGALLTQFQGGTDRDLIAKGLIAKEVGDETALEFVTVNGGRGYWIEGEAHFFFYLDPTGEFRQETYRLAGNVLLWEQDGLTFRLEAEIPQEEALRIAESVQVTPPD